LNWQAIALSLKLAVCVAGILLAAGLPIAYWVTFSRWRWKFLVEAIVVGLEGIGDHQVALIADRHPIGKLVVEAVAVVQKAAQFEVQPACVGARPSGHPADRADARHPLDRLDTETDMLALGFGRHCLVVEPAIAVADDFVPVLDKGAGQLGVTLGRLGDREQAYLDPEAAEQAEQPPTREPYSNTDSTIGLRTPGSDGMPMSFSMPSEPSSPSAIERSPPPSKLRLTLTAMRAPPGHSGSGGSAP